jgi:PAS domain S-box-containing protein
MKARTMLSRIGMRSFGTRLIVFAAVASLAAASLVSLALVVMQQARMHELVAESLQAQGEVIAFSVAPTMTFDRPEEAGAALSALGGIDHLVTAYLFDAQGGLFAVRHRGAHGARPSVRPRPEGLYREDRWLIHHAPVTLNNEPLGTLALVYDARWIMERKWFDIWTALLIMGLAMAAAVLIALRLQSALARPVRELIRTTRAVAESGDYSMSARRFGDDELGELTDAFNAMLARICSQTAEVGRANERFRLAIEGSPNGMVMVDENDRIVLVNATAEALFGYAPDELLGQPSRVLVPARSRDAPTGFAPGPDQWGVRKDGSEFPLEITQHPIPTEHGLRVLNALVDVTERKRAEIEREALLKSERAARSEAEHASHMKDEFVATLSHELRTPLTAIVGWSQALRMQGADSKLIAEGLESIERNAWVQTRIIEDLLDISRIVLGKMHLDVQLVELSEVVGAAMDTVRPAAGSKGIRLERRFDGHVPRVFGDPNRLQQIAWNLLSNAVKFTPPGGQVEVALRQLDAHIELAVSDTGEGITADFLPHLFERFSQADATTTRVHSGLGLGLSLVRHLAELHGGVVSATSPGKDRGATFTVMLPLSPDQRHNPSHTGPPRSGGFSPEGDGRTRPAVLENIRVMVIEDQADARRLIERFLAGAQATVCTLASAIDALEQVATFRPDVIISDIGMPEMDGYQFIRELRRRPAAEGGQVPAIALTALARAEDRARALRSGFQAHLGKPMDPAELVATVASLAGGANG